MGNLDISKSFSYMFEDPNWIVKLLIFGALLLVGGFTSIFLVGLLILAIPLGYMIDVVRNVENGVTTPGQVLPEWTDFGEKFATGIKLVIGLVVWALPGIILSLLGSVLTGAAANSNSGGGSLFGSCLSCLGVIYFLAYSVALPAIVIRFARTRELSSVFEFSQILSFVQANLSNVIVVALLVLLARFIGGLGIILCGIGLLITTPWAYLVEAHLYGQLARATGFGSGGTMTPITPMPTMPPTPPMPPSEPPTASL